MYTWVRAFANTNKRFTIIDKITRIEFYVSENFPQYAYFVHFKPSFKSSALCLGSTYRQYTYSIFFKTLQSISVLYLFIDT